MATTNLNLDEVALSNTFGQLVEMFNGNMDILDGLPIPIEYGKNTTMEYLKFSNGKVAIWGRVEYGTKYPCTSPWASSAGYASSNFTLDLPIALANNNPVVIPHVIADKNVDMWCLTRNTTYTTYTGCFLCAINDSSNINSKTLNMLIIGDWK